MGKRVRFLYTAYLLLGLTNNQGGGVLIIIWMMLRSQV